MNTFIPGGISKAAADARYQKKKDVYVLGDVSGALGINAANGLVQQGNVTGDITGFVVTNLDKNSVLLTLDNSGSNGIVFDAADYVLGNLPAEGIFTVYLYQVGTTVYAVISDAFTEVV